jgi:hypothetical protein
MAAVLLNRRYCHHAGQGAGWHTVAVRFQNHVMPVFSSSLCADMKCR